MAGWLRGLLDAEPIERDPAYEYGGILPYRMNKATRAVDWAPQYSELVKGAWDAVRAPMQAWNGEQMTPEDALNVALNFSGGGVAAGKVPRGAVGMAGRAQKARYPQAQALETARQNAVKMLGLPENNTPLDRARAMGFDYARRSQKHEIPFNDAEYAMFAEHRGDPSSALERLQAYGPAQWLGRADVPVSSVQKEILRAIRRDGMQKEYGTTAAQLAREAAPDDIVNSAGLWDAIDLASLASAELSSKGIGGVRTNNGAVIWNPAQIRSINAAFDPARIGENNFLAVGGLPHLRYLGLLHDNERQ